MWGNWIKLILIYLYGIIVNNMSSCLVVYKNILLPPIQKPYVNINAYFYAKNPMMSKEQVARKISIISQDVRKQIQNRLQKENSQIFKKVEQYKNKYIIPLRKCPSFEEMLFLKKQQYLKKKILGTHEHIKGRVKESIYNKYFKQIRVYLKANPLPEQCSLLPIMLFLSAQQMWVKRLEKWEGNDEKLKFNYELALFNQLVKYDQALQQIAQKHKTTINDILQAKNNQFYTQSKDNFPKFLLS